MVADTDRGEGGSDIDEFYLPSMVKIVVLLPGGGEPVHILGHYVPVDDRQILLFELMCRKVKNDAEREEWDELWKEKMWVSRIPGDDDARGQVSTAVPLHMMWDRQRR